MDELLYLWMSILYYTFTCPRDCPIMNVHPLYKTKGSAPASSPHDCQLSAATADTRARPRFAHPTPEPHGPFYINTCIHCSLAQLGKICRTCTTTVKVSIALGSKCQFPHLQDPKHSGFSRLHNCCLCGGRYHHECMQFEDRAVKSLRTVEE